MKTYKQKFDNILSDILLAPHCRIYRHTILIFVMIVISAYIVFNHPSATENINYLIYAILGYSTLLIISSYINIYILTPRLLLKNKPLQYTLWIVILAICFILLLMILQITLLNLYDTLHNTNWWIVLSNFIASFILLGFIIIGITTIVLLKYWNLSAQRINQLQESSLQSELSILKNQINPHFLFNVINNANVLLKDKQGGASSILFKLEDLLRYQINESAREEILLTSDIGFLKDYLNLEKVRRDKFDFTIATRGDINNLTVPPLLFIPFIENAVKYSQDSDRPSYVHIRFTVEAGRLYFLCENSIPPDGIGHHKPGGLGLKNIRRRLELIYPCKHLLLLSQKETKYIVDLQLKLEIKNPLVS